MVFSSTVFLLFFLPGCLILYYFPIASKKRMYKNCILLLASLFFYAWGEPVYLFLMLFTVLWGWIIGLLIDKGKHRKGILLVGISFLIMALFFFKYLPFMIEQVSAVCYGKKVIYELPLPIGISFFTFQIMSYVFDVYYKKATVQKNLWTLTLYVSMFPQLIAGPIVRYQHLEKQLTDRVESWQGFSDGLIRFSYGLGKKVIIADYLAYIADTVFGSEYAVSAGLAWLGAICYTLQIYYDFSGYSDMAIGLGRMFGFSLPENFNYPYIAGSVTDFWRRWHITLSSWFRDYVYIPMGGNRVSKGKWIRNLLVVWILTGLWHGANWTFLVWGLFYFFLLLFEKSTGMDNPKRFLALHRLATMLGVVLAWVVFRSESLWKAGEYLGWMFGVSAKSIVDERFFQMLWSCKWILIGGIVLANPIFPWAVKKMGGEGTTRVLIFKTASSLLILGLSVCMCVTSDYSPFIYFNF